jgi:hypothetical protein
VASIHRHEKSPYWYVAYTLADGRRAFRSTRQSDRKKALEVARTLERAAKTARQDELTEAHVRKWMDELLETTGLSPVRSFTVRAFCAEWLAGKRPRVGQATAVRLTRALRLLVEGLGPRADKPLSSLTSSDIAAYRNARQRENVSTGTLFHYVKIVRSMLSAARRQGLILTNPAEAVELPRRRAHARSTFTTQELGALLLAAQQKPEWRTLILLGAYTGGRLMDLARLSWDAVDLTLGVVSFTPGKTDSKITVPIHPALGEHLLSIAGDSPGALCPVLSRTPSFGRRGLSKQFINADSGTLTAIRLTRLPNCFRASKHAWQELLYLNDQPDDTPLIERC